MRCKIALFGFLAFCMVWCFCSVSAQIVLPWVKRCEIQQVFPEDIQIWESFSTLPSGRIIHAHYAEIPPRYALKVGFGEGLHTTSWFAKQNNSLLAINAGFFAAPTANNPSGSVGLIIQNGKTITANLQTLVSKNHLNKNDQFFPTRAAFGKKNVNGISEIFWVYSDYRNDTLVTFAYTHPTLNEKGTKPQPRPDEKFPTKAKYWNPDMAVGGMPMLVFQGKNVLEKSFPAELTPADLLNAHPRTCIGYRRDGTVIMLVVDGRQELSHGATLQETAAIMEGLGCYSAINLDGGGSSTMVYRSRTSDSTLYLPVNIPIDKTIPGVQRKVATTVEVVLPEMFESQHSIMITPADVMYYRERGTWQEVFHPLQFPGVRSRKSLVSGDTTQLTYILHGIKSGWYQVYVWGVYNVDAVNSVRVNIYRNHQPPTEILTFNNSDKHHAYKWNGIGEYFLGIGDSVVISAHSTDSEQKMPFYSSPIQLIYSYPDYLFNTLPGQVLYPVLKAKDNKKNTSVTITKSGWYAVSGYSNLGTQLMSKPRMYLQRGEYNIQNLFPEQLPDWFELVGDLCHIRRYVLKLDD